MQSFKNVKYKARNTSPGSKLCRWIAKDQEKIMESVKYLIKMRDDNKAKREAREKKEREEKGLPPVETKVLYLQLN